MSGGPQTFVHHSRARGPLQLGVEDMDRDDLSSEEKAQRAYMTWIHFYTLSVLLLGVGYLIGLHTTLNPLGAAVVMGMFSVAISVIWDIYKERYLKRLLHPPSPPVGSGT